MDRPLQRPGHGVRAPGLRLLLAVAVLLPWLPLVALAVLQQLGLPHPAGVHALLAVAGGCALAAVLLALRVAVRIEGPLRHLASGAPEPQQPLPAVREVAQLVQSLRESSARELAVRDRLERRAATWEAMVSQCPVPMAWTLDTSARAVGHNLAMDRLLGPADTAWTELEWQRDGETLPASRRPLQRVAASGEPVGPQRLELLRPGHPRRRVLAHAVPLAPVGGPPRGALLVLLDLSAQGLSQERRSRADAALRERLHRLEQTLGAADIGWLHHDFTEDRLQWSVPLCRLYGLRAHRPVGPLAGWLAQVDEADRDRAERALWTACALQRPSLVLAHAVRQPDGALRPLVARLALHYDEAGRVLAMDGLVLDPQEMGCTRGDPPAVASAQPYATPQFRTELGHALRTPLGALAAAAGVLAQAPAASEAAAQARAVIERQTRLLAQLADQWLAPSAPPPQEGQAGTPLDPPLDPPADPQARGGAMA